MFSVGSDIFRRKVKFSDGFKDGGLRAVAAASSFRVLVELKDCWNLTVSEEEGTFTAFAGAAAVPLAMPLAMPLALPLALAPNWDLDRLAMGFSFSTRGTL